MASTFLGEFEHFVILANLRLGENAYGVSIGLEIAKRAGRKATPGAIFTTLNRLEDKGFVQSRFGDPTPARGGRARRYFTVTDTGRQALSNSERALDRLREGLCLAEGRHA